jgi:hypothetical protein
LQPAQESASNAPFSFTDQPSTNPPPFSFNGQRSTNPPLFSFANAPSATFGHNSNKQPFTFNQTPKNLSVQQLLPTFIVTSSTHKQEPANNKPKASLPLTAVNSPRQASSTNEVVKSSPNITPTLSKRVSGPLTPISEEPGSLNQEQEESDDPVSLADNSLLAKRVNTRLKDSHAVAVDRSDPNSPLHVVKSFQDFNLKPDLLKGNFSSSGSYISTESKNFI